ncbi:type II toxin-antitoxin system VapC family toxin [Paracoccus sp. DMF-8]|uniref:type II toxin-antitoxin system VapC family toxin n=1 Tax=Paracoccus sp. DMF-8 TaxID=3019445 RepID=UPI0023E88F99|nr:type II toxin-antitoxin system VapC family toxin [Paracoccus sp. DMF-8]MDF3604712.1 type II toxin-antitoxin system VapC family toxin [Paracoccus sp. DMF-8]
MKLLIDTHLLLFAASAPERLPSEAVRMISDPAHDLWFSAASIWEIACSPASARADIDPGIFRAALLANGYAELAVTGQHCSGLTALPHFGLPHFAGILLAQALTDGMLLLTSDSDLAGCAGPIRHLPLPDETGRR